MCECVCVRVYVSLTATTTAASHVIVFNSIRNEHSKELQLSSTRITRRNWPLAGYAELKVALYTAQA